MSRAPSTCDGVIVAVSKSLLVVAKAYCVPKFVLVSTIIFLHTATIVLDPKIGSLLEEEEFSE